MVHKLKWSIQRDRLAKIVRGSACGMVGPTSFGQGSGVAAWFEAGGRGIVHDGERVRLALCPSVKKIVGFYEKLGR